MPHLDSLIDRFLEDHRECSAGGGWAQITEKDITRLYEIVWELIELKCDKDADGDLPIEFKIINRRTHERLHYMAVPYREGRDENDNEIEAVPFMDMMQILLLNLNLASDRVNNEIRCEGFRNRI